MRCATSSESLACVFWTLMAVPVRVRIIEAPTNGTLSPHPGLPQLPREVCATQCDSSGLRLGHSQWGQSSGSQAVTQGAEDGGRGALPPTPAHCELSVKSLCTLHLPAASFIRGICSG